MKELLDEWREAHRARGLMPFAYDGAVTERYEAAPLKICFFLKEAYSTENKDWSLTEFLAAGHLPRMWERCAEWMHGLFCENSAPSSRPALTREEKSALLSRAAVVNVKKSGGRSRSFYSELRAFARRDGEFLLRQLGLLRPDVIVCGGTAGLFAMLCDAVSFEKISAEAGASIRSGGFAKMGKALVLDWYHPACRLRADDTYAALCALYKRAKSKTGEAH